MPTTLGSASGLRRKPCRPAPAMPSPKPTIKHIKVLGMRRSQRMIASGVVIPYGGDMIAANKSIFTCPIWSEAYDPIANKIRIKPLNFFGSRGIVLPNKFYIFET